MGTLTERREEARMEEIDRKLGYVHPHVGDCPHIMRGTKHTHCVLDKGHKGRHSSVGFRCDGCCQMRRSNPVAYSADGEYPRAMAFCFMCLNVSDPRHNHYN